MMGMIGIVGLGVDKNLSKYLEYLEVQKNYSSYTILSYREDIEFYFKFCEEENIDYLKIDYNGAKKYLLYLYEKENEKATTVSRKISSLRSFYRFLANNGVVDNSSFDLLKLPKKEKKLPRYFEYNELLDLFDVPDINTPLGERNRLILELLYATGIRVGELVNIKVSDINMGEKTIYILGKGNKERIVYFNDVTLKYLKKYLNDGRLKLNKNNSSYLFLNNRGEQITTRGIQDVLDKIIKKTSLSKNLSPHMIRHSFATHLLNEGCDLLSVQQLLGHDSLSATSIYTHVTTDRMKEVYLHSHPRAISNEEKK